MKAKLKKDLLYAAVDKMSEVALKGVKAEFDMAARLTLVAENDNFYIMATNGHLDARCQVKGESGDVVIEEDGKITVDAKVCKRVVSALGSNDSIISIEQDDKALQLRDTSAKKKRLVKVEALGAAADITVRKPTGFSVSIDSAVVCKSVGLVSKYKTTRQYKVRYLMICLHFLREHTRFVCGNGMRFGVLQHPIPNPSVTDDEGERFLWPVEQAAIMCKILEGTDTVDIIFAKDKKKCYLAAGNVEMLLKGIPDEQYIKYEDHAFRSDDAVAIVDVDMKCIHSLLDIVDSVKDDELIKEGDFHSCDFHATSDSFDLDVHESRYQCTAEADDGVRYYNIKDMPEFKSHYSTQFLRDTAALGDKELVRFYCIQEDGIMVSEPMNVDSEADAKFPSRKESGDGSRLIFFFASATDTDDSKESNESNDEDAE